MVGNKKIFPARVWSTKNHRKLFVNGTRVYYKRSKLHNEKKMEEYGEMKKKSKARAWNKTKEK